MQPQIEIEKLKNYVMENPSFRIYINGNSVELHFIPNTPEASMHFPDGVQVEHIMYGNIEDGNVVFYKFVTISSRGKTETEILDDDPVMEWMKYI
ncbi:MULTISPECIES: hypothetical protein [Acidiplasma]|uniref:Uncharacterized protein n=2 Tax=Acidiplasma TaxID=507753 RepID=A0A0Q0RI30_9ARCH|nr:MULTISPECIES: hypothetical protein [Acidiplasma]KJE49913.1 hypothetical protein TZ01_02230 [Acidiplasma sp. MBA-1]KPV47279.1 hypothetical protein SE19_01745 [Acidiplasma aeolicum]KQB34990.1 hypothetical protein AOG55_08380 [Acidiplasma cupricumulans]KQB35581.1 hypothetical protein AOG54_00445 [Acidiplasma aeolicum]WMT55097.1 MAG: hypothetical protein RE470_00265 [Acidiplasma sp.]